MRKPIHEVHMIISGFVQGVGYRKWAKQIARENSIVGWVKNREDGAVEIFAQGIKDTLESYIRACQKGPEISHVEDVVIRWKHIDSIQYMSFDVLY